MRYVFAVRIPLEDVDREWLPREGVDAVYAAARHYGIYRDLFRDPHYFLPLVPLAVDYKYATTVDCQYTVQYMPSSCFSNEPQSQLHALTTCHSERGVLSTARSIVACIQFAHVSDVRVQISRAKQPLWTQLLAQQ